MGDRIALNVPKIDATGIVVTGMARRTVAPGIVDEISL
jgi:hypothetical protein